MERQVIHRVVLWLAYFGLMLAIVSRAIQLTFAWRYPGLFSYIGYDFSNLWAQAWVFTSVDMAHAYDLDTVRTLATPVLDLYREQIGQRAGNPPLVVLPGPYPPPLILLLAPLTLVPASAAFAIWIGLNLLALAGVSWQIGRRFTHDRFLLALVPISFYPLTEALILGQPTLLLMCALVQGYASLEEDSEFRAGLWLGLLAIKPQFLLPLGVVLLFKQRWYAILGVATVVGSIVIVSVALLGFYGVPLYLSLFGMFSGFRITFPGVLPEVGISWRALLLNVLPDSVGEGQGTLLTLLVSALTVALLPLIWQGKWNPRASSFSIRLFATMVVTMLVAYHNHVHGATMLVAPGILAFASQVATPALRCVLWAGLFIHPVLFVLGRALDLPIRISLAYIAVMAVALALIVIDELRVPVVRAPVLKW